MKKDKQRVPEKSSSFYSIEDLLLESEEKFRIILENIEEGYYEVDLKGNFTFVNSAMSKIVGYPKEKLIGMNNREYLDEESAKKVYQVFNRVFKTGKPSRITDIEIRHKDGARFWIEFSAALRQGRDNRPVGFRGLIHDITKRKETEKALLETNAQLNSLIQAIPDIIYFKDAARRNCVINKAFEKAFGLDPAQVIGKKDEEILPPDLAAYCRTSDEIVLRGGKSCRFEEEMKSSDGNTIFFETIKAPIFDKNGKVAGLVGVTRDSTERKKNEADLRESEEKYRQVFSGAGDAMFLLDQETGAILDANRTASQLYGYGLEELLTLKNVDVSAEPEKTYQALRTGLQRAPLRFHKKKDGTIFPVEISASYYVQNNRRVSVVNIRDIAQRKKDEEALQAALTEKELLLKEVHHRVKNNMQVISSLLNLQARYLQDPQAVEIFKESQRRIRSMALIHEKLYQSESLSQIEFSNYVKSLASNLIFSLQKTPGRIKVRTDIEEIAFDIQTAIPLGLIINELISNTLKHAFPGDAGGDINIGLRRTQGSEFLLTIKDNGVGLPPNLDIQQTGSMGMELVSMLVDQLEGRVELERTKGTEFKIYFKELKYKSRI
jgi:PAS domain S-box-containing protein